MGEIISTSACLSVCVSVVATSAAISIHFGNFLQPVGGQKSDLGVLSLGSQNPMTNLCCQKKYLPVLHVTLVVAVFSAIVSLRVCTGTTRNLGGEPNVRLPGAVSRNGGGAI